jgi:hypothetical protein
MHLRFSLYLSIRQNNYIKSKNTFFKYTLVI